MVNGKEISFSFNLEQKSSVGGEAPRAYVMVQTEKAAGMSIRGAGERGTMTRQRRPPGSPPQPHRSSCLAVSVLLAKKTALFCFAALSSWLRTVCVCGNAFKRGPTYCCSPGEQGAEPALAEAACHSSLLGSDAEVSAGVWTCQRRDFCSCHNWKSCLPHELGLTS